MQSINFVIQNESAHEIKFVVYLFYCLFKIKEQVDVQNEEFLTSNDGKIVFNAYKYGIKYSARPYILQEFLNNKSCENLQQPNINMLCSSLMFYTNYLSLETLLKQPDGKPLFLNLLYITFSLKYFIKDHPTKAKTIQKCNQAFNDKLNEINLHELFRIVMFVNTITNLPRRMYSIINNFLSELITKPKGLITFTELMTKSSKNINSEVPIWKAGESVVKIVGMRGYTIKFYQRIFNQIWEFLCGLFMGEKDNINFIPIYTQIINNYLNFENAELKSEILRHLFEFLDKFTNPPDLITGLILLEHNEFSRGIFLLHTIFCSASTMSLKSWFLTDYINILFVTYTKIFENTREKVFIRALIVQFLSNRNSDELSFNMRRLLFNENVAKQVHPRVCFTLDTQDLRYQIKIVPTEFNADDLFPVEEFVMLLKLSNHNILIYKIFLTVLNFLDEFNTRSNTERTINSPELADADQIDELIFKNFNKQIAVISTLSELINIKSFHNQIYENPNEILNFIQTITKQYIENNESKNDAILLIALSIFEILSIKLKESTLVITIQKNLNIILKMNINEELREKIESVCGSESNTTKSHQVLYKFQQAVNLCKSKEPYIQVNGINNIIQLINNKDQHTLTNKHVILALAIQILKTDKDSYTYLYCIKLLITISHIAESDVIDTAIMEFRNEHNELDFRLKFGEIIVKITESLGGLAYNYKESLINCFVTGSHNKIDELRTSSLSNLGSICKCLTYQIHNFFQEMLILIESIILNDKFLPARRAAVMTLSQLLDGIENLIDFQDYLLPIYRALKHVLNIESDETTILQASLGLDMLSRKTKEMLIPNEKLEKEIKIFGIKDEEKEISLGEKSSKPKIVELN